MSARRSSPYQARAHRWPNRRFGHPDRMWATSEGAEPDFPPRGARVRGEGWRSVLAGVAPVPADSGQTRRMRLNRGGSRQLNRALHTIALTQAWHDPRANAYIAKAD